MASIYKKGRDKAKKRSVWYISYTDENGKRKTVKGFRDKGQTEQLAAKLENEVMLRKRGLIDAKQERMAEQQRRPIEEHLDGFRRSLGHNTDKHIDHTIQRILKIVKGCGFNSIAAIDMEEAVIFLNEYSKDEDLGHRTYNHYLQAIDSFCNWCVLTRRLAANPLVGMEKLNATTDVRRKRRALLPNEFAMLLESARSSGVDIQCYDGETRARIYFLSYMTGLRRKELASLTPNSFRLDDNPPNLTVEADCSKHRREDTLPVHPKLVEKLRDWLKGHSDDEVLFPKLARRRTWLMVKKDLERVGIPYITTDGVADFHAAGRHTHITELMRSGASVTEAMELARHSDVKMTMRYVHIGINDQARALVGLPVPEEPESKEEPGPSAAKAS